MSGDDASRTIAREDIPTTRLNRLQIQYRALQQMVRDEKALTQVQAAFMFLMAVLRNTAQLNVAELRQAYLALQGYGTTAETVFAAALDYFDGSQDVPQWDV